MIEEELLTEPLGIKGMPSATVLPSAVLMRVWGGRPLLPTWPNLSALYTGLWGTAATIWLQVSIFKRLPAVDASVILSSEPLWAAGFAALLLGDVVTPNTLAGGALIVAALAVNEEILALPSDTDAEACSTPETSTR